MRTNRTSVGSLGVKRGGGLPCWDMRDGGAVLVWRNRERERGIERGKRVREHAEK
jgi:hypothetical protein